MYVMGMYYLAPVILEEAVFRLILLGAVFWIAARGLATTSWRFWLANVLQAGLFGAAHLSWGTHNSAATLFNSGFRIFTAPQTWSGVIYGCAYFMGGFEAAVLAHWLDDMLVSFFPYWLL